MAGTATVGLAPPLQKHKIVFLGDQSVGKTSIIKHFIYGSYEHTYQATIGIDFFSKTVYLDDRTVRLQLWDTAGQERFRSLIPSYIRDSSVAVITYDITNRQSFANTTQWMDDVRAERGSDVVIMLVGNKTDLSGGRKVSMEDGQALAKEQGVLFAECSAKEGHHIKHVFKTLAAALPDPATAPAPTDTQMIDVKLNPNASGAAGGAGAQADGGCGNC